MSGSFQLINHLSVKDKPRERLYQKGPDALSDLELLAIILRTGTVNTSVMELSGYLIKKYKTLENILSSDITCLIKEKGVGFTKAVTLKAVYEVTKRIFLEKQTQPKSINNPSDAHTFIKKDLYGKNQEYLYLLSLDVRRKVISKDLICIGSVNETIVPQREVLRTALIKDAVNIILIHNHPSKDPTPSKEDLVITEKLKSACNEVGITLLDHLIVADDKYTSLINLK